MATKVISVSYRVEVTSGASGDGSTTGQQTIFYFKTLQEVKRFFKNIISSSSTSTANKFYIQKITATWNDESRIITSSMSSVTAEDL